MPSKALSLTVAVAAVLWMGSMLWLTGYKQGYEEGSTTAWDDARSALSPSLVSDASADYEEVSLLTR